MKEKDVYKGERNGRQFAPIRGRLEYYAAILLLFATPVLMDILINQGRMTKYVAHALIDIITQ